jgi:hypothetical protein
VRREPCYLALDVASFFASVDHEVLGAMLARRFKDERLPALLARFLASYETAPGRGLPIGSLMSQHLANFYLGPLDRFVKETLRVRGYARYMDDVLWGASRAALRAHLCAVRAFVAGELRLAVKDCARIGTCAQGLTFLGAASVAGGSGWPPGRDGGSRAASAATSVWSATPSGPRRAPHST